MINETLHIVRGFMTERDTTPLTKENILAYGFTTTPNLSGYFTRGEAGLCSIDYSFNTKLLAAYHPEKKDYLYPDTLTVGDLLTAIRLTETKWRRT